MGQIWIDTYRYEYVELHYSSDSDSVMNSSDKIWMDIEVQIWYVPYGYWSPSTAREISVPFTSLSTCHNSRPPFNYFSFFLLILSVPYLLQMSLASPPLPPPPLNPHLGPMAIASWAFPSHWIWVKIRSVGRWEICFLPKKLFLTKNTNHESKV